MNWDTERSAKKLQRAYAAYQRRNKVQRRPPWEAVPRWRRGAETCERGDTRRHSADPCAWRRYQEAEARGGGELARGTLRRSIPGANQTTGDDKRWIGPFATRCGMRRALSCFTIYFYFGSA
jgi:hypothetical protein